MSIARVRRPFSAVSTLVVLLALGAGVLAAAPPADAAQGPVGLGTATSFAVLAGSGITNTGATTVTGDIGTFPTPSETGFGSITLSGTNHDGDAVTQGAKNSLVAAYNDAAGRNPATNVAVELGGSTLFAGVYTSPTLGLTGTLTLDAKGDHNAEFIFQAGSTLITASDSHVLLINGADPCHVVWQVGSSATFNTRTQFVGDVLAQTSITAQTGATFQGRLLARDGAVTLDHNTITNANCVSSSSPGTTPTTVGTTAKSAVPSGAAKTASTTHGVTPGVTPGSSAGTPGTASNGTPGATPTATSSGPPTGTSGGPPTGTSGVPPTGTTGGTPTGTPGTPTMPRLPFTGLPTTGLISLALVLLAVGGIALVQGRKATRPASRRAPQ